jgi:hypothetical protein
VLSKHCMAQKLSFENEQWPMSCERDFFSLKGE